MMKCSLLIAGLYACSCPAAQSQNLDINLLRTLNARNPACETLTMQTSNSVYWAAPTITLGALGYGLLHKDKNALRNGFESALSVGISMAVSGGLKELVNRQRPDQAYPDVIRTYTYTDGKSFPSGHTTLAFATATSLALTYKKWYITVPAYAWAAGVGYSRMRLGRHYPSDVAAGALIGVGSAYLSHWVTGKLFR
jgi:membrane-associated phospholipid phosphatase